MVKPKTTEYTLIEPPNGGDPLVFTKVADRSVINQLFGIQGMYNLTTSVEQISLDAYRITYILTPQPYKVVIHDGEDYVKEQEEENRQVNARPKTIG